jgi:hypothetical protein
MGTRFSYPVTFVLSTQPSSNTLLIASPTPLTEGLGKYPYLIALLKVVLYCFQVTF